MIKATSIEDLKDRIVQIERAAHVTFYIATGQLHDEWFLVYSESKDKGLQLLNDKGHPINDEHLGYHFALEDAQHTIQEASRRLEEAIERKRSGIPTEKQVYFLFTHKIPIPLDLTWGQASDLIDEKLNQIAYEREKREEEKKSKQSRITTRKTSYPDAPFYSGDKVHHPVFGSGIVLHTGYKKAGVQFGSEKQMVEIQDLTLQENH